MNNLLSHLFTIFKHRIFNFRTFSVICVGVVLSACTEKPQDIKPSTNQTEGPTVTLSIADVSLSKNNVVTISEGSGDIIITAELSEPLTEDFDFAFFVDGSNSTATNLNDFLIADPSGEGSSQTVSQGLVKFTKGETITTFQFRMSDDLYHEDTETFIMGIINNPDGTIKANFDLPTDKFDRQFIQFEIADDDDVPIIAISSIIISNTEKLPETNIPIGEEEETIAVTLSLPFTQSSFDLNVNFEMIEGAGVEDGIDYQFPEEENRLTPTSDIGKFVIPKNADKFEFFLRIFDDVEQEIPETLTFRLIGADRANITQTLAKEFTITINDSITNNIVVTDTGIDSCFNDVSTVTCGNVDYPNQDPVNISPASQFIKFNSVIPSSQGASTPLDVSATSWECVYDSTTNLLWAIGMDFRQQHNLLSAQTVNWYNENPTTNGGATGSKRESDGDGISSSFSTDDFQHVLNAGEGSGIDTGLCNVTTWRLPKYQELMSILDFETSDVIYIDTNYFPNTYVKDTYYWTTSPSAIEPEEAWCLFLGKKVKNSGKLCAKSSEINALFVTRIDLIVP